MSKFTKRPVTIEAVQFTEETKNQAFNFITCNHYPHWDEAGRPVIRIETLEGEMTASFGDWIIKGVEGEFYPCKPAIFDKTYLPAGDPVSVEGVVLPTLKCTCGHASNMHSYTDNWCLIDECQCQSFQNSLISDVLCKTCGRSITLAQCGHFIHVGSDMNSQEQHYDYCRGAVNKWIPVKH